MIKVNIWSLWTWLLHMHALELWLCTNVLSSCFVHEMHEMSNHNTRENSKVYFSVIPGNVQTGGAGNGNSGSSAKGILTFMPC